MAKIQKVWAVEILDSRANPTVECAIQLDSGAVAVASVPSGASTGTHEALELRDNDPERFKGKGVVKAVTNVNQVLGPAIVGMDPTDQDGVDNRLKGLDSTPNKSKLGANAILSVSLANAKAASIANNFAPYKWVNQLAQRKGIVVQTLKVPTPVFNMINGGLHGAGNLDFQEFFVIPASSKKFSDGLREGAEIYLSIGENLKRRGAIHSVGDEGGYAPNLFTNADALEILVETIKQTPYAIGRDVFLGLDVAASHFFNGNAYSIRDKSAPVEENGMLDYYRELNGTYHLAILEDPLNEDSWSGWKNITQTLGAEVLIVGDDLLATNPQRVQKATAEHACNAILVKPNQIGTVTETLEVIKMARDANWKIIISHRSGETNDWFIADFGVGVGADYAKFGAPARGERVAKYNRLSSIEVELSLANQNA
ncbi:phosphopyruvate hydratase [Candidatus Woesebacteria bacterium]|nr:phosphopyruvate hydratase [Candidatus Woesebacteria bacterium]QQG47173.1 MAG: phosphopyruvate hydratase [Candidatus Woesebacteria bacterium]